MIFDKRFIGLIIIVGFIAGLVGASYTHLLHGIQHFVYNYSSADHLSFGAAVARVSPIERLIPLIGLAAVYNSPLSAAIFTLETLLLTWNIRAMSAALLCCGLATFVTRQAGVGDVIQYTMAQPSLGSHYVEFSIVLGAIIAIGVVLFNITQSKLPAIHRSSPVMIPISIVAFTLIGVLAMYFPEILGNGKAGNELTFTNDITWTYALGLFGSKWVAVLLALAAGAYGGRITPSMMLGSTLGIVFGTVWAIAIAPVSLGMSAFVGAVVFLGLAQKMPMTSCVFMLELSRFSVEMLFPIALTMGTALMVEQIIQSKLNSAK